MARNLQALLPLVLEYGPGRIAFCTDDRDPEDNRRERSRQRDGARGGGGMASRRRTRSSWRSFHPAQWHGLDHLGAVAAGSPRPTCSCCPISSGFRPDLVAQARPGRIVDVPSGGGAEWVRHDRAGEARLRSRFSRVPSGGATIRAIGLIEDQVVTESLERRAGRRRRSRRSRTPDWSDLAKIAVRPSAISRPGRVGLGFVSGSGLPKRSLALVGPRNDAHNLVVVGMTDDDMAFAVGHLAEIGGGIVVVNDGRVRGPSARSRSPACSPTPPSPT